MSQRTREIGLRMAIGAQHRDIVRLIVGRGLRLAVFGLSVGLVGAAFGSELLHSLLFGVSPTDVPTFAGVPALLLAVVLLASYLPARHAMRVDPLRALREE